LSPEFKQTQIDLPNRRDSRVKPMKLFVPCAMYHRVANHNVRIHFREFCVTWLAA